MTRLIGIFLYLLSLHSIAAPTWDVDLSKSRLSFSGEQAGAPFEGVFERFDATLIFDPEDLAVSRFHVEIPTESVNSENDERDEALRGADFFHVKQWATALFVTTSFTAQGDHAYNADAKLTMRDVTKDVLFPFTVKIQEQDGQTTFHLQAELTVKRLDYGIGQGEWQDTTWVGNDVLIKVDIHAIKQPEASRE